MSHSIQPHTIMTTPSSAILGARPAAASIRPAPARGTFWRRVFDAWLLAYGRVDGNGDIVCAE
jgi:hypothetical protein